MTLSSTPAATAWWPDTENMLDAALVYHRTGLCVIPLKGKRPALKTWKQYQITRPTERDIRRWASDGLLHNIGIVCGSVSNNLVVLDCDGPGAYAAFAALFPTLAQSYTVATGSGQGQHVYFYVKDLPDTVKAMDTPIGHLELRANGCQIVASPSIHPVTDQRYVVEKPAAILQIDDLSALIDWLGSFKALDPPAPAWQPPRTSLPHNGSVNPDLIEAIAVRLRQHQHKASGDWINCSCPNTVGHKRGDKNPSFGFNTQTGYGYCYACGSMLSKDLCALLHIDIESHGGLIRRPDPPIYIPRPDVSVDVPTKAQSPAPPEATLPSLSDIPLPGWLQSYVDWASQVGSQTPQTFHLGMGIWMAGVAIARRLYVDAPWGIRLYPNLYMMFIADTTFYRKTTGYKLGERILSVAIPHMLMPTPGSPERFQDALAGQAPGNFSQLPQEHQKIVLEAGKFAAQRGLFKDEIAGLFGAFKRDYMAGLKDFMLEIYDCPDYLAKETQSGLAIIRDAAPSILGVTTPAGLAGAISIADFDNGLLPRFALLTPEEDYHERPTLKQTLDPPAMLVSGLRSLHDALPMPERSESGWEAAGSLNMPVEVWEACQAYSNQLRRMCDPRQSTPLDDRLKGIYGRLHVQAMKVAMICSALDWLEKGQDKAPTVTDTHWQTGQAIAEHWRISAGRLLDQLDRSGSARLEFRTQDKVLNAVRGAGAQGITLHTVYKNHNLQAAVARQIAKDLVQAGQIVETRIGRSEAYVAAEFVGE